MRTLYSCIVFLLFSTFAIQAQCDFDATISGEFNLCPDGSSTITTEEYDAYQWYKRAYNSTDKVLINGATEQNFTVEAATDVTYYFSVEVTKDNCTESSGEVLIDQWVFLFPTVSSNGNFTIGPNGETFLCEGDTMYFELNQPYTKNITWYKEGVIIDGETTSKLIVTEGGNYTVSGAPEVCPDYIQNLGLNLTVELIDCVTDTDETAFESINLFPNPSTDVVYVRSADEKIEELYLYDLNGRLLIQKSPGQNEFDLDLQDLSAGLYLLKLQGVNGSKVVKLEKK